MGKLLVLAPALLLGLSFLPVIAGAQTLASGTEITVRTNEPIDVRQWDRGRIYRGELAQDLRATDGDLAFTRGTPVELTIRQIGEHEMVLDLESIIANGRRFVVDTTGQTYNTKEHHGTAKYVGGGAVIGSIIGAIAGGAKGAVIGAAAGAATGAGAQAVTCGRELHVPVESLLTFRLEQPLHYTQDPDGGYMRDGHHYHDYPPDPYNPDNRR